MKRAGHYVAESLVYGTLDTRISRYSSFEMDGQLEFIDNKWPTLIASKASIKAKLVLPGCSLHGFFTFVYHGRNFNNQNTLIRSVGPVVMLT